MNHRKQWLILSPLGLALIGFGASVTLYAGELRVQDAGFWTWFVWGTLGLVILNSGVACFGEAVKHRVLLELQQNGQSRP